MKIDNLSKVGLTVRRGSDRSSSHQTAKPVLLEFIYGIANDGLCPFEMKLHLKIPGESIAMSVPESDAAEFFGHLYPLLCRSLGSGPRPETWHLGFTVSTVVVPDNREVVQALAQTLGHGCGDGNCDCGCG